MSTPAVRPELFILPFISVIVTKNIKKRKASKGKGHPLTGH